MVITIKNILFILKKIIYAFLLLFSLNISIKSFGIIIPINFANLALVTILGIPGLIGILIIKIVMF